MAKKKNIERDINLLPLEYKEKEKYNLLRITLIVLILLLFSASGYLYFVLENQIYIKENEVANLQKQLAAIERVIAEVRNLERDKAELAERVEVIENLIKNQSRLTRVLGDFSETTLDEVWLNNLSINVNQSFNLTANTFNNYLIARFMNTLKDHRGFDAIELQYIRKQSTRIPEFDRNIDIVNFQLTGFFIPYILTEGKGIVQGK